MAAGPLPPHPLDTAAPGFRSAASLGYWRANLADVLREATELAARWAGEGSLEVWGPVPPELAGRSSASAGPAEAVLIRLPSSLDPFDGGTGAALHHRLRQHLRRYVPPSRGMGSSPTATRPPHRLLLLHRATGRWDAFGPHLPEVPTLDPTDVLRLLHLHTPYRLVRRRLLRRRNAVVQIAELHSPADHEVP